MVYFGIYNVALFPYISTSDVNWHTAQKYDNKCLYNHKVDIILLLTINVSYVTMITLRRINLTKTKILTIHCRCTNPYSVILQSIVRVCIVNDPSQRTDSDVKRKLHLLQHTNNCKFANDKRWHIQVYVRLKFCNEIRKFRNGTYCAQFHLQALYMLLNSWHTTEIYK